MKQFTTIVVICTLASFAGCASNPPQERYYSLVLASDVDATKPISNNGKFGEDATLIVGPVYLARYLDQPGLPLQTSDSQIQSARHHFWAEALDEAIAKVLVQEISRNIDTIVVDRDAGRWTPDAGCRVRFEFDKFHAVHNSTVMAAGRYWIHRANSSVDTKKEFKIVRKLSADGYAHAVIQLRAALATLALEIADNAELDSDCRSAA